MPRYWTLLALFSLCHGCARAGSETTTPAVLLAGASRVTLAPAAAAAPRDLFFRYSDVLNVSIKVVGLPPSPAPHEFIVTVVHPNGHREDWSQDVDVSTRGGSPVISLPWFELFAYSGGEVFNLAVRGAGCEGGTPARIVKLTSDNNATNRTCMNKNGCEITVDGAALCPAPQHAAAPPAAPREDETRKSKASLLY